MAHIKTRHVHILIRKPCVYRVDDCKEAQARNILILDGIQDEGEKSKV